MSDQIDKFCLVQNGKDGWIVETKFVFKLGTDGNPVPIDLNEEEDQICFVKTDTRQINNVVVVGSSDDATALRNNFYGEPMKIRTLKITTYSPQIPNNDKSQQKPITKTSQASSLMRKSQHSGKRYRELLRFGNGDSSSEEAEQTHDDAILDGHNPKDQDVGDVDTIVEHDEDSESNVNPRRRTVPSPPIRNDTFERVRARSARLSGTGSSSGNNGRRSRRVNSVIRRPLRSKQSLIAKIKSLERSVNSLRKTVRKLLKKVGQGNDNVTQETYPELEQRVIVEGGNEFVEIEGVKIDGEQYAKMLLQNSLRGRANVLMHDMWPDNVMRRMYLKAPPGTQNYEIVKSTDIQKIKNICLYLQRKKKIEYISGGKDDVSIYARNWAGDLFKNCRKKLNDQNVPR